MVRGTVIAGRYELEDLPIGRGGMGEVWGGYDQRLDRKVAVKFIRFPDGQPDPELVRRFVRESRITARLEHPGVPIVYDAGTHEDDLYLVMQLIHGLTVADLVAEHEELPVPWVAAIGAQACAVLAIAHARSLVHRDLKPNNLILCGDGTVKVLDFGLAAAFEPTDISRITRTGETLGTPAYMAPEQAMSGVTSPQSDLYSLGCVLYEMATGRQPFTAPTPLGVMRMHTDQRPRPVSALRPGVPDAFDGLIARLLAKKPEWRPDGAARAYRELLPLATGLNSLPGALPETSEPDAVRMYATVVGRVAAVEEPRQSGQVRQSGEPSEPAKPEAPKAATGTSARASISRGELERARREAGDLTRQARFSQAAEVLSGVVENASVALGRADTDVLSLRLELADVLFLGGDYRGAAPAFRDLAGDLAGRDGRDGELVLRCRQQEATCNAVLGETTAALRQLNSLLVDEKRVFGPDDERTLELRRQIGLLLLSSGDSGEAQPFLSHLLADLERVYGAGHPSTRGVRELLAGLDRPALGGTSGV